MTFFEQALVCLPHLSETRETLVQAIDLRLDLRKSLWPLAELDRIYGSLREAERLARTLDDRRRLGWVSAYLSVYFSLGTGHMSEARSCAQSALAIAQTLGDFSLQVAANWYLGLACLWSGDYRGAKELLRNLAQSLEGELSRQRFGVDAFPAVGSRGWLALTLAERGEFTEGIAHGQQGIRVGEALDHPFSLFIAYGWFGILYRLKGELSHAVRLLERALALARDWNIAWQLQNVMGPLGSVYTLSGRVAEGLSLLEQALKALESRRGSAFHSLTVVYLGEAYVLAGRFEEALALAAQLLAVTRERGQRGIQAWTLRLLGEIASHRDPSDIENATKHYREAISLADELGMRPLVAHCHLGLGRLYGRPGKRQEAQEHLTSAATMYRDMDMGFWLTHAEALLKDMGEKA